MSPTTANSLRKERRGAQDGTVELFELRNKTGRLAGWEKWRRGVNLKKKRDCSNARRGASRGVVIDGVLHTPAVFLSWVSPKAVVVSIAALLCKAEQKSTWAQSGRLKSSRLRLDQKQNLVKTEVGHRPHSKEPEHLQSDWHKSYFCGFWPF